MRKIANILMIVGFLMTIIGLIVVALFVLGDIVISIKSILLFALGIMFVIFGINMLKIDYHPFLIANRDLFLSKKLKKDEKELIDDAIQLIKRADKNYEIADFIVYKIVFSKNGFFYFDPSTKKLNIFIPFSQYKKNNKNILFESIVHEILHSQNLKDNIQVFNNYFLEGLNQYLTEWLIENYSEKYEISNYEYSFVINLGNKTIRRKRRCYSYKMEVNTVKEILKKSNIDVKEIFTKYVDFDPIYFVDFVPVEYFKINR